MSESKEVGSWGRWLQHQVALLGLSEVDFARLAGVHKTLPQKWYSGQSFPSRKKHPVIAHILGMSVEDMLSMKSKHKVEAQVEADKDTPSMALDKNVLELLLNMTNQISRLSNEVGSLKDEVGSLKELIENPPTGTIHKKIS